MREAIAGAVAVFAAGGDRFPRLPGPPADAAALYDRAVPGPDFAAARASLDAAAWRALEQAYQALTAGGLPCGAALADAAGTVVACGRNHAYDPLSGDDPLQGTPLAHAELNVLARVRTDRDLSADTLWSTQQPCAMCTAAIGFCGVGRTRYLAADPAFLGTSDPRAGIAADPTRADPALAPWAALANAMFLWPTISRTGPGGEHIRRNRQADPEFTDLAVEVFGDDSLGVAGVAGVAGVGRPDLAAVAARLWPRLADAAERRATRLNSPSAE
jgi:tRNA(Arg) A34 adenosine deaminase TadA